MSVSPESTVHVESLLNALGELQCQLAELAMLSTRQSPALTPVEWDGVFTRKQQLLDAIEARQPATLFQQTHTAVDVLSHLGYAESARHLEIALRFNQEAFEQLAAAEQQACRQLDEQIGVVRERLIGMQRCRQIRHLYGKPSASPRSLFLDGRM